MSRSNISSPFNVQVSAYSSSQNSCLLMMSLEDRLHGSTLILNRWLYQPRHQIKVSQYIKSTVGHGQLTLRQAFNRGGVRHVTKFPP